MNAAFFILSSQLCSAISCETQGRNNSS